MEVDGGGISFSDPHQMSILRCLVTNITATLVAVVDLRTRVSFLLVRCRYLSIFRFLLLSNLLELNLKVTTR